MTFLARMLLSLHRLSHRLLRNPMPFTRTPRLWPNQPLVGLERRDVVLAVAGRPRCGSVAPSKVVTTAVKDTVLLHGWLGPTSIQD